MLRLVLVRVISWIVLLLLAGMACRSVSDNDSAGAPGIIVVNAPANGEVKRIITPEGVHVNQGAPVIEIAVMNEAAATKPNPGESAEAQAVHNYKSADARLMLRELKRYVTKLKLVG